MGCRGSKEKKYTDRQLFNINSLGTGDCVFFAKDTKTSHKLVQWATRSEWNHVGLVVYLPELYPKHGNLLLESSPDYTDGLVDILSGKVRSSGVRLVDLNSRIQTSTDDEIACRQWRKDNRAARTDTETTFACIVKCSNKPYEQSMLQLVVSATPINQAPDESSLFCSELVASCLQGMRIVGMQKSSNSYTPATLGKKRLKTTAGSYTPMMPIKTNY
jgi:hypothetical protein